MSTIFVRYEDWFASIGRPEHHVVIGPDWWTCLCGDGYPDSYRAHHAEAGNHAKRFGGAAARVDWLWADVHDVGPTVADLHRWLWEAEAF